MDHLARLLGDGVARGPRGRGRARRRRCRRAGRDIRALRRRTRAHLCRAPARSACGGRSGRRASTRDRGRLSIHDALFLNFRLLADFPLCRSTLSRRPARESRGEFACFFRRRRRAHDARAPRARASPFRRRRTPRARRFSMARRQAASFATMPAVAPPLATSASMSPNVISAIVEPSRSSTPAVAPAMISRGDLQAAGQVRGQRVGVDVEQLAVSRGADARHNRHVSLPAEIDQQRRLVLADRLANASEVDHRAARRSCAAAPP